MTCRPSKIYLNSIFNLCAILVILILSTDCIYGRTYGRTYGSRRHKECTEKSLEEMEEIADVVMTGTVRDLMPDPKHSGMFKGKVEVIGIYKGKDTIKNVSHRMKSSHNNRDMIIIEGLGDPDICASNVLKQDTKIFLMKKGQNGIFKLSSSVLRITLDNLNHAYAAVEDIPYVPPAKSLESLCRPHFCSFHATCRIHASNSTPYCACIEKCPTNEASSKLVCGTDRRMYMSECFMKKASCEEQRRINVANINHCRDGAQGQVIEEPCLEVKCDPPNVCQLDKQRKPVCRCADRCTDTLFPVCGSDGRTYSNECVLRMEACRTMRNITVLHESECRSNPCDKIKCRFQEDCTINRNGIARCTCHPKCEQTIKQVCGTDGITYNNDCELKRQACKRQIDVKKKHVGRCGPDPCSGKRCEYGARCELYRHRPTCECPKCTNELQPVCGSDGYTYDNECKLRYTGCVERRNIEKIMEGQCSDCGDHEKCDFYAACIKTNGVSNCVCPTKCADTHAVVCGTNGKSYENECKLRVDSCKRRTEILIASIGECVLCRNVICKHGTWCNDGKCVCPVVCPDTYEPVCANDGRTYQNECKMKKDSCLHNKELQVVMRGTCTEEPIYDGSGDDGSGMLVCDESTCQFGGVCQEHDDGTYRCVCNFNCPAVRSTVCGSDGKTYGHVCQLREEVCRQQRLINLESQENCDGDMEDLCDGSRPLTNPNTFMEYNCTETKLVCPANSYCHLLEGSAYGKCCQQDITFIQSCHESEYGCCPDNKTFAQGPDGIGCLGNCQCNPRGSKSTMCDPERHTCMCKPGVGGNRCDRCLPGYWGLAKQQYTQGCQPCNCNILGRERSDCNQMDGRCLCKPGILGNKCDRCPNGSDIAGYGCGGGILPPPRTCSERPPCEFEGVCRIINNVARCVCDNLNCNKKFWSQSVTVCGSDGVTYESECHLKYESCRKQIQIDVDYQEPCHSNSRTRHVSPYLTTPPPNSRSPRTTFDIKWTSIPRTTKRPPPHPTNIAGGKITDLCMDNSYCYASNSHCRLGVCSCKVGYIATMDNTHCSEVEVEKTTDSEYETACSLNPCRNNGKCIIDQYLGYRCLCPFGKTGPNCRKEVPEISTPSFSGISYMAITNLSKTDDLTIELIFKSFNKDGLLMFSSQYSNGTGDFISLALVNGYVEFRYDLGSGSADIRSSLQFSLNHEVRVVANLHERDGVLLINGNHRATGMSPPTLTDLGLNGPVYLGFVPEAARGVLLQKAGVNLGFAGCMVKFKVGHKLYDLTYQSEAPRNLDVLYARDIRQCEKNPCQSMPCANGGTCLMNDLESYSCHCDNDYTGEHCEVILNPCVRANCQFGATCRQITEDSYECVCPENREGELCEYEKLQKIFVPEFNGSSYIQLPLGDVGTNTLSFKIWFLTKKLNGVLMYASQYKNGRGDFISVNLVRGHVEFRFNMGGGTVIIKSGRKIQLNKWHEVKIEKINKTGTLMIDNNKYRLYTGEIDGNLNELNLQNQRTLFLGGFKSRYTVPIESNITTNFTGVIQRIYINGRSIEEIMKVKLEAVNINEYIGPPCNVNPCLNGGVCVPKLTEADCNCPIKYIGLRCEKRANGINKDLPVKFDGTTHLQYMNQIKLKVKSQRTNKYTMKFRLMSRNNGLILFQQGIGSSFGDYFAIGVFNGYVELSYNLGGEDKRHPHIIRSTVKVSDGNWHTLVAQRDERRGSLQVDEERTIEGYSSEGSTQLDTDGILWIGGKHNLPQGLPTGYYSGFMGCIDKIYIDNSKLHMVDHRISHRSTSIKFCK